MNFVYLSILLSVIIGILIIAKIRSYDLYEKEAFATMFMAFIMGGAVSVFMALGLYELLRLAGLDHETVYTVAGSFFIIGPVEEFSKLAGLAIVYRLIRKQFNEVTDGVIYMSCVALGFSIIENYFYANSGDNTEHLLFFRALISTPAHISFSCLAGYAFYRYKNENRSFSGVVYALILASLLHGVFDALAFSHLVRFFLIFYLYLILRQSLKIVQYSNIMSPFRPQFSDLFSNGEMNMHAETECPYCKAKTHSLSFSNSYFTAIKCESCGYHFTSIKNLDRIFRTFAPEYKRFRKKIFPVRLSDGKRYLSIYGSAYFEEGASTGFFNIADLSERLNLINQSIITTFRKTSLLPKRMLEKIIG